MAVVTAPQGRPRPLQAMAVVSASQFLLVLRPVIFLALLRKEPPSFRTAWLADSAACALWVGAGAWFGWQLFRRRAAVVTRIRTFLFALLAWSIVEWYGLGFYTAFNAPAPESPFTGQASMNAFSALFVLSVLAVVKAPPSEKPRKANLW